MPRVCWAAGLAVHTAGGEYKPTPTQCRRQRLVFDRLRDRKRWREMNGTHRLTDRDRLSGQR